MRPYISLATTAIMLSLSALARADIKVNLPADINSKGITSSHYLLSNLKNARRQADLIRLDDKVQTKNNVATISLDSTSPARYQVVLPGVDEEIQIFANPGDDLTLDVQSIAPLRYTVSGTPLMEGISAIRENSAPLIERFSVLTPPASESQRAEIEQLYSSYQGVLENYIKEFPASPAVCYALLSMDDALFDKYTAGLSKEATASLLYPFVEQRKTAFSEEKRHREKLENLQSGNVTAPMFNLENTEGKKVSLAEFRGKWVILDFWGSWCIWCIKGFPELKEAYKKYDGVVEIIGLDCNESQEAWKAAVAKYELPWVNLYCPKGDPLLRDYDIQGFPTKAIIDPEGKIRNITVGHNPDFFNILDNLISGTAK